MRGSEWLEQLSRTPGEAREQQILQAVRDRNIVLDWYPIYADVGPRRLMFLFSNALQIGEPGDSVRPPLMQKTLQAAADELNAVLPTQRLADLSYYYADVRIPPQFSDVTDHTIEHIREQSQKIDRAIAGRRGLTVNEGKLWLMHSKLKTEPIQDGQPSAVNYGMFIDKPLSFGHNYATTLPGVWTVQGPYTGHGFTHVDYSQLGYFVARPVEVCEPLAVAGLGAEDGMPCVLPDGSEGALRVVDIYDVIEDPLLRGALVAGDPALDFMRHPAVPWGGGVARPLDPSGPAPVEPAPARPALPPPGIAPAEPLVAGLGATGKVGALALGGAAGWFGVELLRRLAR